MMFTTCFGMLGEERPRKVGLFRCEDGSFFIRFTRFDEGGNKKVTTELLLTDKAFAMLVGLGTNIHGKEIAKTCGVINEERKALCEKCLSKTCNGKLSSEELPKEKDC